MIYTVYKLTLNDFFYYGFSKNAKRRFQQHKSSSLHLNTSLYQKLKEHTDICQMQELYQFNTEKEARMKENDLIKANLNTTYCLNERLSYLNVDDKKNAKRIASKKFASKRTQLEKANYNKEKKMYMRRKRFQQKRIQPFQDMINSNAQHK